MEQKELQKNYYELNATKHDSKLLRRYSRNWEKKIQMIVKEVQSQATNQLHILEAGVGTGMHAEFLIKNIIGKITGIDLSFSMLKVASVRFTLMDTKGVNLINADAEKLPFADESFDYAFCIDTLHHVYNPIEMLREMLRVVKPKGKIIVIEPHAFFPANLIYIFCPVEWNIFKMSKRNLVRWGTQAGLKNLQFERPAIYFPPFPRFCFPIYDKLESAIKGMPLLSFFSTTTLLVGEKE